MTAEPFSLLYYVLVSGVALIAAILTVRLADQWRRDTSRVVIIARFPRNLTAKQLLAVVRVILGLAPPTIGLLGRASVALEVVGTWTGITFRLRLPARAAD